MMMLIASCISQLKWQYFQHHSHRLNYFQIFDDASRGLWGSFTLLFDTGVRALIVKALALVSLIIFGVNPSV
jgi:hypothetical protein